MSILVRTVTLKNYKSIARCRVDLADLTVLVGPSGSGKSNFLDALRLVSDGLRVTLDHALRDRGGLGEVRRKSGGHPTDFAIGLQLQLEAGCYATYGFEIGSTDDGRPHVKREEAVIAGPETPVSGHYFRVRKGRLVDSDPELTEPVRADGLYLEAISGHPVFGSLHGALAGLEFYNIVPDQLRKSHPPDENRRLRRDGGNIAAVIERLARDDPAAFDRVRTFLGAITPGLEDVEEVSLGPAQTLVFRERIRGAKYPWPFLAHSMSDGTLRALAILTAAHQSDRDSAIPLIGIEEPETALHPGATAVLMDALFAASRRSQILLTTAGPTLLDLKSITDAQICAVRTVAGNTVIGPVDGAALEAVRRDLYTLGESRRSGPAGTGTSTKVSQGDLFPGMPRIDE